MPFVADTQSSSSGFIADKRTIGGFAGNVAKSGGRLITDTASAVLNPVDTVKNIIGLVKDPMVLVDYYKNRYGKDLATTLYEDPVGVLADLSTLIGGAGAVVKGVGAVSKASGLSRAGSTLSKISRATDPLMMAGKVVKPITNLANKPVKSIGNLLSNASDNIATSGLGSPKKLQAVKRLSDMPIQDFFDKYNLWDRSPESVQDAIEQVSKKRGGMIDKSTAKVSVSNVVKSFDDEIESLRRASGESDVALQQMSELMRRKDNFLKALTENETTPLNVSAGRINESQKLVGGDVRSTAFTPGASMTGSGQGTKKAYELFRRQTEKAVPGTQKLGREEAALIKLKEIIENADARQSARQNINFSKLGGATVAGATFRSIPAAVGGFVAEQFVNSPTGSRILSKTLKKTGQVLKESKSPDLTKFSKVTSPIYQTARGGRMVNQKETQQSQGLVPKVLREKNVSQPIVAQSSGTIKITPEKKSKNPFKTKKVNKGSFY